MLGDFLEPVPIPKVKASVYRVKAPLQRAYLKQVLQTQGKAVTYYANGKSPKDVLDPSLSANFIADIDKYTNNPFPPGRFLRFDAEINLSWGSSEEVINAVPSEKPQYSWIAEAKKYPKPPPPPPPPKLGDFLKKTDEVAGTHVYTVIKSLPGSAISETLESQGIWISPYADLPQGAKVTSLHPLDLNVTPVLVRWTPPSYNISPPRREAKEGECAQCFVTLPKSPMFRFKVGKKVYCKNCKDNIEEPAPIEDPGGFLLELYSPLEGRFHPGTMSKPSPPTASISTTPPPEATPESWELDMYSPGDDGFKTPVTHRNYDRK